MEPVLQKLGVGVQKFEAVRLKNMIYVDKTAYLPRLEEMGQTVFLSRPRRFGKSLTISTLDAFYSGRTDLFNGLAAYSHMVSNSFVPRPVIRLDMAQSSGSMTVERLEYGLNQLLKANAKRHEVELEGLAPEHVFLSLLRNVFERYGRRSVVLVDEYDSPVINVLQDEKAIRDDALIASTRKIMRTFYTQIKSAEDYVDFTFITGVTKFARMGVFSQLNNVTDISINKRFGAIVGFTQDEIESYFPQYLARLAEWQGTDLPSVMERIRYWYNGFSFDGIERLYNPFSIVSILSEGEFENFWMESGSASLIREFIRKHDVVPDRYNGLKITRQFAREPGEIDVTPPEGFLYQAGYLSLRKSDDNELYVLEYPNAEVLSSVSKLFVENLFRSSSDAETAVVLLKTNLKECVPAGVIESIYRLFAGICYDDTAAMLRSFGDDTGKRAFAESVLERLGEYFYRTVLLSFLRGAGTGVRQEVHTNLGRADLVIDRYPRAFIIEMKISDNQSNAVSAAENGMRQILGRKFGDTYPDPILMSVAMDLSNRNIGACLILDKRIVTCLRPDGQGGMDVSGTRPAPDFTSAGSDPDSLKAHG
jgi:hypothetical protein